MGAWDLGNFDNDDAMDFVSDLTESDDLELVHDAIESVVDNYIYIEGDEAAKALVAGEVVALIKGKPADTVPVTLMAWQQAHAFSLDDDLQNRALEAVRRVMRDSELEELWKESDEYEAWLTLVEGLIERLQ